MKKIFSLCFALLIVGAFSSADAQTSCVSITHNLRYQASDKTTGGDVTKLQAFLKSSGYLSAAPSGYFGPATLSAVKKFQAAQHVDATGYVGPMTRTKISTQSCASINVNPTPSVVPTPTPASVLVPTIVSFSPASTTNDGISPVVIDGTEFGSNTVIYLGGLNGTKITPSFVAENGKRLVFSAPRISIPPSGDYGLTLSNDGVTQSNEIRIGLSTRVLTSYRIITDSLGVASVGQSYTTGLQVIGFNSNYTWSITSGSLPPGITFLNNGADSYLGSLILVGIPQLPGIYPFTIQAADASGNIASAPFVINVLPDPNSKSPIPALYGISPSSGYLTTTVNVTGSHFDSKNYVLFDGRVAGPAVSSGDGRNFTFYVPKKTTAPCNLFNAAGSACSSPPLDLTPGTYSITIQNTHGTSLRSIDYTVLPPVPTPTP